MYSERVTYANRQQFTNMSFTAKELLVHTGNSETLYNMSFIAIELLTHTGNS